ncbi:MAG TPA: O-antigen ligase family protein [Brevibacterium linens]|nr:O-antigen ligase family protein [Brevibacterium linens]
MSASAGWFSVRTEPAVPSRSNATRSGGGWLLLILLVVAIVPVAAVVGFGIPVPFMVVVGAGYALQLAVISTAAFHLRLQPRDPWIAIAVLYGIVQTTTLASVGMQYGTYDAFDLLGAAAGIIGIVAFAGLFQAMRPNERDLQIFLVGFLWLTFVATCVNLVQHAAEIPSILGADSSYQFEFASFFANRNQFGYFLFLSLVAHALYLHGRRPRFHNIGLFALQIASLLLTMSRGSIAASLIFLTVFGVLRFRSQPKYAASFLTVGGIGAVAVAASGQGGRLEELVLRPEAALAGRDEVWSIGLDIWREHGILLGSGSFRSVEIAQERGMPYEEFHSFFVETLVGGGIVELVVMLSVLGLVWRKVVRSRLDIGRRHVLYASAVGVAGLACVESVSFFTVGLVGTLFTIFFVSLPLLYAHLSPTDAQSFARGRTEVCAVN